MDNPFAGYGTTVVGERLVGRDQELDRIVSRIARNKGSISIVGLPRIGKTSLVAEALDRVTQQHPTVVTTRLNGGAIPNAVLFLTAMLDGAMTSACAIRPQLLTELEPIMSMPVATSYQAYLRAYRGFCALRERSVFCVIEMDEFDAIRKYHSAAEFVQQLRDILDQRRKTGVSAILISRRSLAAIEKQIADVSTLSGVCEHHHLRPLNKEGFRDLVARAAGCLSMDETSEEKVWGLTGGHPYLTEMLLCHSIDAGNVDSGWEYVGSGFFSFYEQTRELLSEDDLWSPLLQLAVGPQWSIPVGALERLLGYGIIRAVSNDPQAGYRGWSSHFQDYLEKLAREAPVWELWSDTERSLRSFVEATCIQHYGDDWLMKLSKKHKAMEGWLVDWTAKRDKERKQFGANAAENLLSYSYPGELKVIVFREWTLFEPVLGGGNRDKTYWDKRFDGLMMFRNAEAHNRAVPQYLVHEVTGYCQELLSLIRG